MAGRLFWVSALVIFLVFAPRAGGKVQTQAVVYRDGETALEGFLAYDEALTAPAPGVIVVHEWWGLTDHPKKAAVRLAELGYVALAIDLYGQGKVTDESAQAAQWSADFRDNPELTQRRFTAGLNLLRAHAKVEGRRIAAIGYCFGGTVCLEVARLGVDLAGVVSFHGNLASSVPAETRDIKAAVLVCHGADDPHVPIAQVEAFVAEMRQAGANWQLNMYGGAVHSFTNPDADRHQIAGVRYDAQADRRSWQAMQAFLAEVFVNKPSSITNSK